MHSVSIPPAAPTESQQNIDATLARADAAHSPTTPQSPPTTPPPTQQQKLAGRFDNVEDLEKAYKELQAEFTRRNNPNAQQQQPPAKPEGLEVTQQPSAEDVQKTLESKGLDFQKFADSFYQNGQLTEEDFAELEKAGINRQLADTYVKGVEALRQQTIAQGHAIVGGQDVFKAMTAWAAANLPQADIDAYNAMVTKGGNQTELALLGLKSKWQQATGGSNEPNLLSGRQATVTDGDTFSSIRELAAAQRDPRYGKDAAYTRSVEQKAARSKF